MKSAFFLSFSALVLAACGGKVFVDSTSGSSTGIGGSGGSATSSPSVGPGPTTSGPDSNVSTGPQSCGSLHVSPDPQCESCAEQSCCAEMADCDQGTSCGQLLGCIVNCPMNNSQCQSACSQKFPGGAAPLQAISDCLNNNCALPSCGDQVTTVCDSGLTATPESCAACMTIECCPVAEQCGSDPACQKCQISNAGPDCSATYAEYFKCKEVFCGNVCP